jgi:hypothetical protein
MLPAGIQPISWNMLTHVVLIAILFATIGASPWVFLNCISGGKERNTYKISFLVNFLMGSAIETFTVLLGYQRKSLVTILLLLVVWAVNLFFVFWKKEYPMMTYRIDIQSEKKNR